MSNSILLSGKGSVNLARLRIAYCLSVRGCSVRHLTLTVLMAESCPSVYNLEVWSICVFSYLFLFYMPPWYLGASLNLAFCLWWFMLFCWCCCSLGHQRPASSVSDAADLLSWGGKHLVIALINGPVKWVLSVSSGKVNWSFISAIGMPLCQTSCPLRTVH